ncbi:50S ribosomal protein L6 [Candidatus Roizmanbacteria bacterium]|nr:50S ribosomal protein L6 [Candidatus Roizmanbacteria bacterium]
MSKIGQKPVTIPSGVTVTINENTVHAKGPKGEVRVVVPRELKVKVADGKLTLERAKEIKRVKSLHGLFRQLIYNAVTGVTTLWTKRLEVVGTGFNVKLQGEDLVFKLGYSHSVVFKKVADITFQVEGSTKVIVSGCDKQLVGQLAYQVKILRKPDVYKGKGIRYEGEVLRIKPGKKAKAAGVTAA